jgi:hypothetical protein
MPAFLTGLPLRIKCESSWKGLGMELSPGNLKKKKKKNPCGLAAPSYCSFPTGMQESVFFSFFFLTLPSSSMQPELSDSVLWTTDLGKVGVWA